MDETTISMPVKQYAECIMALQKLVDIRRVVAYSMDEEEAMFAVKAIMRITEPMKEGEQE